ncbi:50S ribosomal protein L5 [Candidatus Pacearchaeota archaeon]|nr:50S ribosomal protein L5 [Candidatus Pacearchaeota archaeon]
MANVMEEIRIEKVVISVSGTAEKLEKGRKLLEILSGKKPAKMKSTKRIPSLGVRPGLEVGALVTLRRKPAIDLLRRLLAAVDDTLKRRQISAGTVSFGIKEYIEIPGMQYNREIGMAGLDVSISFYRLGKRVKMKKIKTGKIPAKNKISKEEVEAFLENKLGVKLR